MKEYRFVVCFECSIKPDTRDRCVDLNDVVSHVQEGVVLCCSFCGSRIFPQEPYSTCKDILHNGKSLGYNIENMRSSMRTGYAVEKDSINIET